MISKMKNDESKNGEMNQDTADLEKEPVNSDEDAITGRDDQKEDGEKPGGEAASGEAVETEAKKEQKGDDLKKELEKKNLELEKKDKDLEALKELLKRRQADFENYKKRMVKMQEDYQKLAIKDLALDIIGINDDLLRAIDAASNVSRDENLEKAHNAFVEGVSMISRQIEEVLRKYGIEEIDSLNQVFNPNYNEAVEIDMSEDVDQDTITWVYQKGFKLEEYILRSAKVRVSKPAKKAAVSPEGDDQGRENGE